MDPELAKLHAEVEAMKHEMNETLGLALGLLILISDVVVEGEALTRLHPTDEMHVKLKRQRRQKIVQVGEGRQELWNRVEAWANRAKENP